jgi:hypothetical protein
MDEDPEADDNRELSAETELMTGPFSFGLAELASWATSGYSSRSIISAPGARKFRLWAKKKAAAP